MNEIIISFKALKIQDLFLLAEFQMLTIAFNLYISICSDVPIVFLQFKHSTDLKKKYSM